MQTNFRKLTPEERRLVEEHLWCVKFAVRDKAYMQYRVRDEDECIEIGYEGLCRAAMVFDAEIGLRFSTYAIASIKNMLRRHLYQRPRCAKRTPPKGHLLSLNSLVDDGSIDGSYASEELIEQVSDPDPLSDPADRCTLTIINGTLYDTWRTEAPIMYEKYVKGRSLRDIGDSIGMTPAGVKYRIDKERKKITRDGRYTKWADTQTTRP